MRTRFLASHLREFGWEPIVICVEPRCYEEPNDNASLALLPDGLQVERVGTLPARVCRQVGIGDVSLRAQWAMRRRVRETVRRERADLVFATVLPGYTSLVGAWAKRKFALPFVLDYQDPWVSDWGARQRRISKAGFAHRLAAWFEPGVVRQADALTAVSDETLDTLRTRKLIRYGTPVEIIPIGADMNDHRVAERFGRSLIDRADERFHVAYVGTLTERMLPSFEAFLRAIQSLHSSQRQRIRIHLIGTSAQAAGKDQHNLPTRIAEFCLTPQVHLHPARIGYLDALRTMQDADLLLLLGSTDSHYTASKIFPCWLARKPIMAVFHSASSVNHLACELGGISVLTYDMEHPPASKIGDIAAALRKIFGAPDALVNTRNESAFEPYSAHGIARRFAALFDLVAAKRSAPIVP
jgi:Glycosyl transferase 4-like domain